MMAKGDITQIQVSHETRQRLRVFKARKGFTSYDKEINFLLDCYDREKELRDVRSKREQTILPGIGSEDMEQNIDWEKGGRK